MRIHELDPLLANQIAAGEVVQRPASVVKELLENSIDAKAKNIRLTIMGGGSKLIRITDDGQGVYKEDLSLAISRHATSKISHINDLENIHSLGFRGEALASISSVSRFKLISCPQDQEIAWEIRVEGRAKEYDLQPSSHPNGTTVEVGDLFFNTPARKKFLRSEKTEFAQIEEVVKKILLSHWEINFIFEHNQRSILNEAAAMNQLQKEARIANLCGNDFLQNAVYVQTKSHSFNLSGWISLPQYTRSQSDQQYFFVNGRAIRDKLISHAVKSAYQDVMYQNRHPAFVLFFELAPDQVDVNVHPSKDEVRFRDSRMIHQFIQKGIESALAQLTPQKVLDEKKHSFEPSIIDIDIAQADSEFFREEINTAKDRAVTPTPLTMNQIKMPLQVKEEIAFYTSLHNQAEKIAAEEEKIHPRIANDEHVLGFALGQLQQIYILAENQDGLIIVDMHAAHERILYEKMKREFSHNQLKSQQLLVPIAVNLSSFEMEEFKQLQPSLQQLGFVIDELTALSVVIRQIPVLLQKQAIEQLLKDTIADFIQHSQANRADTQINEILGNLACKSAVQANRKLTLSEMNALLRELERTPNNSVCNHGRPVWRHFDLTEIDKFFLRGR